MAIPTSIPFLEAAYAPKPRQPDTGGESFMRAFERAQDRRDAEPERLLRQKNMEQTSQLNALRLTDAIRSRDDAIAAEGSLTVFADRIRRAQLLGPSEAAGQRSVIEWVEGHRGILTLPAGKAMWEDYLKSVEDDRRHVQQIAEIKARGDVALQTQAAMGVRQSDAEAQRQSGRLALEKVRADLRRELKAGAGQVTREQWINRQANNLVGRAQFGETTAERATKYQEAVRELGQIYDAELSQQTAPPVSGVAPKRRLRVLSPTGQTGTIEEGDLLPDGWRLAQ